MLQRTRFARALVLGLAVFALGASPAVEPLPPFGATVEGQRVTKADFDALSVAVIGVGVRAVFVSAPATNMPMLAHFEYYSGKNAAGRPVVVGNADFGKGKASRADSAEDRREGVAALFVAALDAGGGGPTWQHIYRLAPATTDGRIELSYQIVDALSAIDKQIAGYVDARVRLLEAIPRGTARRRVAAIFAEQHIVAAQPWTTQTGTRQLIVTYPYTFEPGCYFSTEVAFSFDRHDRLSGTTSRRVPDCL